MFERKFLSHTEVDPDGRVYVITNQKPKTKKIHFLRLVFLLIKLSRQGVGEGLGPQIF